MNDSGLLFAVALSLAWWGAFTVWFLRRAGLFPILARLWRGSSFPARVAAVAAVAALSVYGGSKSGPTNRTDSASSGRIPHPSGPSEVPGPRSGGTNQADALRWTAFAVDGDAFDFSVAWPETNLAEFADLDVFHSETLDAPSWRWIRRESVWPEDLCAEFSVYADELPYWEEVVSRRFRVETNEVESPFGVTYTNLYARVQSLSPLAPRSGFFLVAGQHDADGDGVSDAVERSLGYDPADPDMDGDGLPDGRELALGADPLAADSDGDGIPDGFEVSCGTASTDGASLWIGTAALTNRIVLFADTDDGGATIPLPFPFRIFGTEMTNLAVNANGVVGFSSGGAAFGSGLSVNGGTRSIPLPAAPGATVAAFWDDLLIRPDMGSLVSFGVVGSEGCRTGVVEFSRVGFYEGSTNDVVSFQVQFHENETNTAHVVFSEASGPGTGASATLGARSSRDDGVEYSCNEENAVFPGLAITYRFGCGADPTKADTDGDGLADPEEIALGTNPSKRDTDGDGIPDGAEVAQGTNPLLADSDGDGLGDKWETDHPPFDPLDDSDGLADSDGDGLSNAFEITRSGTDWQCADTDGDGLSDFVEWTGFTDPLDPDCDGDGLLDGEEVSLGTAPQNDDTDGDGMPDGWEVGFGFDPLDDADPNPSDDADGDGLSCLEEARFGTSPFAADTDGDGLPDGEECGCVFALPFPQPPFDMSGATNIIDRFDDLDEGSVSIPLPFPIRPTGMDVCSNIVVGINGRLALATDGGDSLPPNAYSARPVVANAFDDDLLAYTNELGSALSVATFGTNGVRRFVVEYRSFGFYHVNPVETNSVSFQVSFAENDPDAVRVCYFRANPQRGELSARALGWNAELSVETERRFLPFAEGRPVAHPGLAIEYRFGTGTSPLEADTDGDGFSDGAEFAAGTDPLSFDTDGDGLSDGEEVAAGRDPGIPNAGNDAVDSDPDGDGLTNGREASLGTDWDDPDTDGDGVSDFAEWNQGSDPLDADDFAPRQVVEAVVHFGDASGSHSEKYKATITPVLGDPRPPMQLCNRHFGEPDDLLVQLVSNAVYEVSLRHVASNESTPDLDYSLAVEITGTGAGMAVLVLDPDELFGDHDDVPMSQFGKKAMVAVVHAEISVDLDRDGAIGATENATPSSPLRMWLNNDDDSGAVQEDSVKDAPGEGSPDSGNDIVDGLSDLVDFFPVHLDLGDALETIASIPGFAPSKVEVRLSCGGATLGCVETDFEADEAGKHLSDPNAGVASAAVAAVGSSAAALSPSLLTAMRQNHSKGVVLLEGKSRSAEGTAATLTAEIVYDGECVLSASLPVLVAPVEEFYRWYNFRAVCNGAVSRGTDTSSPLAFPDSAGDTGNVIFIHGFSVDEDRARGWNAEMFKRLWQSGCNSKFHAVTWYGNDGVFWNAFDGGDNYHGNVVHAFETAPAFASQFSSLVGETTVIAHSLGNMVVSSAIQDHGFRPDRFFMLNAAVPAEAFDATQWDETALLNPMVHQEWVNYPSRTWPSHWHNLFQTNDIRHGLTWTNRFADVPDLTSLYNYYSTGDEVLAVYDTPNADGSGKITIDSVTGGALRNYSWQKQERFKGRAGIDPLAGFGGTSDMGWGFSTLGYWEQGSPPMYDDYYVAGEFVMNHVRTAKYTFSQATAAANAQLVSDPVFRHGIALGIPSGSMASSEKDVHLARGVPALSGPAGSRAIGVLTQARNENLNGRTGGSSWPRNSASDWPGWRHSDIKDIALPYVFDVLSDICGAMEDSQ